MSEEKILEFFEFCKNYVLDNIDDYEGCDVYGCDLGCTITESMRYDGTFTYSIAKAKRYLMEWFADAAEYSDYEKFNFGERSNPFDNVELFIVRMVCEGVNSIVSRCKVVDDMWNEKFELTEEVIASIKEQVEEQTDDNIF
ncbi:MAG: hypothetical protein J6Y37_12110 [Paludibacteraceae bacterium]|nr:hypothetical protein [Paludibacteraceae bacterium]